MHFYMQKYCKFVVDCIYLLSCIFFEILKSLSVPVLCSIKKQISFFVIHPRFRVASLSKSFWEVGSVINHPSHNTDALLGLLQYLKTLNISLTIFSTVIRDPLSITS